MFGRFKKKKARKAPDKPHEKTAGQPQAESVQDEHCSRRHFFTQGLKDFFSPVKEIIADKIDNMPDFSNLYPREADMPNAHYFIRPPGALPEDEFIAACLRCGSCSLACPHDVITMMTRDDVSADDEYTPYSWRPYKETGTPRIQPGENPCRMCEDFPCAAACPSGALVPPAGNIAIGYPLVDEYTCLRMEVGEDCQLCVESCPVGEQAITLNKRKDIAINEAHCTGCGFCQQACPQEPAAIKIYAPEMR